MEKCIYIVLFLLGSLVLGSCEDDCSAVAEGDNQKNVIQLSIVCLLYTSDAADE